MVMTSLAQVAVTPEGKSVAVPTPVAPVVTIVISVSGVFIHNVGVLEGVPNVLSPETVMVPVAFTDPHPPVNGIE